MKGVTAVCRMRNSFLRHRRRSTPQPLTGEPFRRQFPQSLPCKGRWMRRKAQTEGCIAALRRKYPATPGRTLPCLRRGRCLHRPGSPAAAQAPMRRAKSPALHCGHKQVPARKHQPAVRPAGGPMKSSAPTQGGSSPKASPARGGGCAARRRRRGALPLSGKNILQGPAGPCPASVRDDACIAPETLRCRKAPAADKPSAVTPAGSKFRW